MRHRRANRPTRVVTAPEATVLYARALAVAMAQTTPTEAVARFSVACDDVRPDQLPILAGSTIGALLFILKDTANQTAVNDYDHERIPL